MNLKSPLRRTAAVVAGALIGLSGAFALTGPASAHHPTVIGGKSCVNEDGSWEVTWKVTNSEWDLAGQITGIEPTPGDSTVTGIAVNDVLPKSGDGPLTAVQKLKASDNQANLKVTATWVRNGKTIVSARDAKRPVWKSHKKCQPTTPPTTTPPTTTPPTTEPTTTPPTTPPTTEPTTTPPTTPPTTEPTTSPTPSTTSPAPTKEPEFVYEETCDTVTVGITVPADWPKDVTVVFTTNKGDSKTVIGKIGKTTTVEFKAVDGLKITATPEGYQDEAATITYHRPADCDTSGGGGGDDDGGSLPVTGAAAGSIAGGAAVLLGVGAGLFFMARRRKLKFTA